ncbi:MAG: AraC family transcriptional regulator [Cyanobacteria bacterium P01_H01_bin.105]
MSSKQHLLNEINSYQSTNHLPLPQSIPVFQESSNRSSEKTVTDKNFSVEKQHLSPGELELEASSEYTLCFTTGTPFKLLQQRADQCHEAQANPGDIAIVTPDTPSRWCWTKPAEILIIRIAKAFVDEVSQQLDNNQLSGFEVINKFDVHDTQIWNLGLLLQLESSTNGCGIKLYRDSLLTALTIRLLECHTNRTIAKRNPAKISHSRFQQIIDYINEHLAEDLSLKRLSSILDISPNYFAILFKQAMGIPPHQYVIQCRVERAKHLLVNSKELSVADIALLTGFSDQSHLSRHMRKTLGVCPREILG